MNIKPHILLLSIPFMIISCLQKAEEAGLPVNDLPQHVINRRGDTIPTGVWIPIKGRYVDIDSLGDFQTQTLKTETKKISLTPKEYPVEEPEIAYITEAPNVIIPGENGTPLPQTLKLKGRVVAAKYPKPVSAASPQIKDRAIADIRYLSMKHGMRYGIVRSLIRDTNGYLWMGTHGGVSRYDGKSFLHFKEGLPFVRVGSVLEDSQGTIWIQTLGGLASYNGQSFVHFTNQEGFPLSNFGLRILGRGEKDENIWLESGEVLTRFTPNINGTEGTLTIYNQDQRLFGNTILGGFLDESGNLWFGSNNGKIYIYKPAQNGVSERFLVIEQNLENSWVLPLLKDSDGAIWSSTPNGHIIFDLNLEKLEQAFTEGENNTNSKDTLGSIQYFTFTGGQSPRILEDRGKNIWFLNSRNGIFRYNPLQKTYTHLSTQEGLSYDGIRDGFQDEYDKFWLATFGGGVNIYNPNSFQHYSFDQGLTSDRVYSILEDKNGKLWLGLEFIGSGTKTIQQYDPEKKTIINIDWEGTRRNTKLSQDKPGYIWGLNGNKLCKIDPAQSIQSQCIDLSNILNINFGGDIFIDKSQRIWIRSLDSEIPFYQELDGKRRLTFFPSNKQLIDGVVLNILEDRHGNIWIASRAGISKLVLNEDASEQVPEGRIIHYTKNEGLNSNTLVFMLLEDRYGVIWAATQNGLHRFVPEAEGVGRFESFGVEDGLSYHDIRSLIEDKNGNIWIGTYKGLSVLVRDTASSDPQNDFRFYTFTHEDGLKELEFMQKSVLLDSRNTLWMGTLQGLISIDLNTFTFPTLPPENIELTHISVDQQFVDYRRLSDTAYSGQFDFGEALSQGFDSVSSFQNYPINLRLPHNINNLTFHVSAIDWYAPHKIQYQFWMSDVDKTWSDPQPEPNRDYRNLDHGKYTLRVRAIGAAQIQSKELTYSFSIRPPWWLSWWAYALYALLIAGVIYLIIVWRTISLRRQQQLLRTRVQEQTQEIRAEQERANELLLNILPAAIAQELKEKGETSPVFFKEVSILFADFKGFTNIVASIPGEKLVSELDDIFKQYDSIMESVGLEKIQTVGDAYLAACGVPNPDPDHASKCVKAGKRIIAYLEERNQTHAIKWQVRLGIHSGSITAGVIGVKKFSYDIFGDTVNIASRIESSGEPGKINVSAYTYDLIKEQYPCIYRGKINAKGKGELDMYFVE